jgi:hypothetical protein
MMAGTIVVKSQKVAIDSEIVVGLQKVERRHVHSSTTTCNV